MNRDLHEVIEALGGLDPRPTARELADALWLARFLPSGGAVGETSTERAEAEGARDSPPVPDPARPDPEPAAPRTAAPRAGTASPQAGLHIAAPTSGPEARMRSPALPVIPRTLDLARALRPLHGNASSATVETLLEEATAQHIAETGIWQPVMAPAPERFFDLALIVDSSASMAVWGRHVTELHTLLEQLGAFRDVRLWRLNTDDDALTLTAESGSSGRSPNELIDPTRRRVMLLYSDCIGRAWGDGRAGALLERWAEVGPVAIVQPLPQRLWWRCGTAVEHVRVRAGQAGLPNSRLVVHSADGFITPPGFAVPVMELQPRWLQPWAEMVGSGVRQINAMAMFTGAPPLKDSEEVPAEPLSPQERVLRFRASASPQAFQLAGRLAAAPLRLQVMSLVQQAALPDSNQTHLAEVFLGGLIRRVEHAGANTAPDDVLYDFHDGVRDILLSGLGRGEALFVLRKVWDVVRERLGSPLDFPALLRTIEQGTDRLPDDLPFAHVAANVLRRLGGRYARIAEHLPDGPRVDVAPPFGDDPTAENEPADGNEPVAGTRPGPAVPVLGGGLPARNRDFTGRDALLRTIRDSLSDGVTTLLPAPPHELGGQGKSQLAIEYAHRHADDYDLIWWVPAEQIALAKSSLADLAGRLGTPLSDDINRTVEHVRDALRAGRPYARWLLIFDNATEPDGLVPFMPVHPGRGEGRLESMGHVLVTSRHRGWADRTATAEIGFFERPESVGLIRRLAPDLTPAEADLLAERVGDLPLAVEQAAAWHAATGRPSEDYLLLLDRRLGAQPGSGPPREYPAELAAVLEVSLDRLRDESSAAGGLLEMLAFFGPEPVPIELLSAGASAPLGTELETTLRDADLLRSAMGDIHRYALGRFDPGTESLQVHRVVRTMLQRRLSEADCEAMRDRVHRILAAATPQAPPEDERTWGLRARIAPHVEPTGVIGGALAETRAVALDQMRYRYLLGDFEGSRFLGELAVAEWSERWGDDDRTVLEAGRELGIVLRALGDVAAAARRNADVRARTAARFGPDHRATLMIVRSVAADLRLRGDFTGALELDQDTWQRNVRMFGRDHLESFPTVNNVGIDLRLLGRFEEALKIDSDAHARMRAQLGDTHRSTQLALAQVARDLHGLGRYREASERQGDVLEKMQRTLGRDHEFFLHAEMSRAVTLRSLGAHDESRRLAEETLRLHLQRFGESHHDTSAAQRVLAMAYVRTDDADKARLLVEDALKSYRRLMGTDHPFVHACTTDLTLTLRALGGHEPARAIDDTSLQALTRLLGADHYYSLCCSVGLVHDLYNLGRLEAAHRRSAETHALFESGYGAHHPYTLACGHNHHVISRALGREAPGPDPLTPLRRVLGDRHPDVRAAREGRLLECVIDPIPL